MDAVMLPDIVGLRKVLDDIHISLHTTDMF